MPFPRCLVLIAVPFGITGCALLPSSSADLDAQRRYILEQKNRTELPGHYEPITFAGFLALPTLPAEYAASDWEAVRAYTRRAVSLEGYIAEVVHGGDGENYGRPPAEGDFHVHLRGARQLQCFPGGARGGQLITEVTPHFQPPKTGWSYEALRDLCERQVPVRISGWLFHDSPHVDGVGRWRGSAWEIHPVTKIEVWHPAQRSWQTLP